MPQGTSNDIGNSGAAKAQPVDTTVKPPLGKKRKVEYVCVLQAARLSASARYHPLQTVVLWFMHDRQCTGCLLLVRTPADVFLLWRS